MRLNQIRRILALALLSLTALCFAGLANMAQESSALSLETTIPLSHVKGRIDHFSVDVKGRRIFVSAVENHTLEVIDLQTGRQSYTIKDLAEPQGVFYDASTGRLYVACALDGVTRIFDGNTFQPLGSVKFPDDADNIRYDPHTRSVIIGYAGAKELRKRTEGTGALGFLDSNGKKMAEVVMDAHPESFQLEKTGTRIFVNVPDNKEIEVVDAVKRAVVARWPVTSAKDNFPMALDETHHRLFIGTWVPPRLLVFDTQTGKEVAAAEIAGKSDDLFYDSARARVYVLTSESAMDVFQQKDPDHYERVARIPTAPRGQTGLFVPEWGKLFVALPNQGDRNAEVRVYKVN